MTSIDSPTLSDSAPAFAEQLAGLDPAGVQDWLDQRVAELAAEIERELLLLARQAVDRYTAGLTAAADPAAFDHAVTAWSAWTSETIGPNLAILHKAGNLAAVLTAPSGQPLGSNQPGLWAKVVDEQAVAWAGQASNRIKGVGDDLWTKMRGKVAAAIETGRSTEKLKGDLEQLVDGMSEFKADTIARTEVLAAYNNGDQAGAAQLGAYGPVEKVWLAAVDARTRPTHAAADGQVRKFAEPFSVGGVSMMYPHAPGAPAGEVVNCRCVCNHLYAGDTRPDGSVIDAPAPPPPPPPAAAPTGLAQMPVPQGKPAAEPTGPGKKMTDAQLHQWVKDQLVYNPKASASKLLAEARSRGFSVSAERMRSAVQQAKSPGAPIGAERATPAKRGSGAPTGITGRPSRADVGFMREHDSPLTRAPKTGEMTVESAARRYTSDSTTVNRALRTSGEHPMTANLDAAMKAPKNPIEVYRGAKLDTDKLPTGGVPGLQGKVFRDRGYLSTSAGHTDGPAFGGNIGMRITVNDSGAGAYVQPISAYAPEREYLVARDQPLFVSVVRKADPNVNWENKFDWIVEAETVSPDWVRQQGMNAVWDSNRGGWTAW